MTEDEAKTKWCPFGRAIVSNNNVAVASANLDTKGHPAVTCIASSCMMWVTTEGHNDQGGCGLARGG